MAGWARDCEFPFPLMQAKTCDSHLIPDNEVLNWIIIYQVNVVFSFSNCCLKFLDLRGDFSLLNLSETCLDEKSWKK